ncbi:MAG: DUF1580 domain-containing protein [Phycisphaerales bacterium]|nr:DUF1580 domain-containing protein [Phycisphaerales bacterium]
MSINTPSFQPEPFLPLLPAIRERLQSSRPGARVAASTAHRWRTSGVKGVRLKCWRVGGRWTTTAAAVSEFIAALNSDTLPPPTSAGKRQAAIDAQLDAIGI